MPGEDGVIDGGQKEKGVSVRDKVRYLMVRIPHLTTVCVCVCVCGVLDVKVS